MVWNGLALTHRPRERGSLTKACGFLARLHIGVLTDRSRAISMGLQLALRTWGEIGSNSAGWVNALLGGWQWSALGRRTSRFPMSLDNGYAFPTNWELESNALQTAPVQTGFW